MKFFKKLIQVSSAAVRLAVGIGGAMLIFLALKDKPAYRTGRSERCKSKDHDSGKK